MANIEEQEEVQPSVVLPLENLEAGREQAGPEEHQQIIYPDLPPVVFCCLHQTSKLRRWCIDVVCGRWLNLVSVAVSLLSCVIQGSFQPGIEDNVNQEAFEAFICVYFMIEMLLKMVALGPFGHRISYFSCNWHRLDVLIIVGEVLDLLLLALRVRLKVGHVLKPMRLISRVPSIRELVSILLDILPMFGHVLVLFMFVIHIFGVVGVGLWAGQLHNRCFMQEDIVTMYNLSLSPYFVSTPDERISFVCSRDSSVGKQCTNLPHYRVDGKICTLPPPQHGNPGNWGVSLTDWPSDGNCVNWNQLYNVCRPDGPNPSMGSLNFDNIGYAWIAVFQVITLEGWTDIMYYVMDAHSFWSLVPFILITILGSFILMNTGAVVIAYHFSEARIKGRGKLHVDLFSLERLSSWLAGCFTRVCCKLPDVVRDEDNLSAFLPRLLETIERLLEGNLFTNSIMVTIFLNVIIIAIEHHDQPEEMTDALNVLNIIFTMVFAIEMILKLMVLRTKYFTSKENLFDFAIVIISLWEIQSNSDEKLSVVRVFRMLRFMKLLHFMPYLKKQLMVLVRTVKDASTLCMLMLLFIFTFSVMGMHLFGCKFTWLAQNGDPNDDRKNFDSLLWSMVTVFQILTQEDWNVVLYNAMASTSAWAALYFVAIILLGKIILLNVLVGIVVENMQCPPSEINDEEVRASSSSPALNIGNPNDHGIQGDLSPEPSSMDNFRDNPADISQGDGSLNPFQKAILWIKRREDWSLYLLSPQNKVRLFCQRAVTSDFFEVLTVVFIVLNCITIAMESPDMDPESTEYLFLDVCFYLFSFVFFVEMLMKVAAWGLILGKFTYFRSPWNMLDGLLVIISLVQILINMLSEEKSQILSILKVLRLLRVLRMIKRTPKLKLAVEALVRSVKPISNIILICCVLLFFFGILGVQLFKGKFFYCVGEDIINIVNKDDCLEAGYEWEQKEYNFDSIVQALISLFVMFSKDGWVNIMYDGLDAVGVDQQPIRNYNLWMLPYFLSFMVTSFFLLDMFIGAMVDTFHLCQREQRANDGLLRAHNLENEAQEDEAEDDETKDTEEESPGVKRPSRTHYSHMRQLVYKLCTSRALELVVTFIIVVNILIMGIEHYDQPKYVTQVIEYSNYVFNSFLIAELLLKLVAFGVEFVKDSWNLLDIGIILVSIVSMVLTQMAMAKSLPFNPSILRVCRILRLTQVLKVKTIRVLLSTVMETLAQVGNICLLFMFFFFIFAALGVEFFGQLECSPDYPCLGLHRLSNFKNFPMALLTLYKVSTGDNWNEILKDTMRKCRPDDPDCLSFLSWLSPIYFSIFVIVAQFVMANLIVATIMQALEDSMEQRYAEGSSNSSRRGGHDGNVEPEPN